MSDAERTERPTARKLRRARERGETPRSPLASGVLALVGVVVAFGFGADAAVASWRALATDLWVAHPVTPSEALARSLATGGVILLPPLALAVALGALGALLQVGPMLTPSPLRPRAERLDPAQGLSRLFGGRGLAARLGGLPLALGVAAIALWTLRDALPGLLGRVDLDAGRLFTAGAAIFSAFFWRACALLAVAAAVAVGYARWRWWREQHMTRREVRQEQRETEGDPTAKRRRARLHRERAMGPSLDEAAARATLAVVAPGVAVTIEWTRPDAAPVIGFVAKGAAAARLRAASIPAHRDVALAGALARLTVKSAVPKALWPRVARAVVRATARGADAVEPSKRGRPSSTRRGDAGAVGESDGALGESDEDVGESDGDVGEPSATRSPGGPRSTS